MKAKKDDMKSAMSTLRKENDELKMDLIKAGVRGKHLLFAFLVSWAMFAITFYVHGLEDCRSKKFEN